MLEMKEVTIKTEEKMILENLTLKIKAGEIHAIMGPNGAGKSTLCKAIVKDPEYKITKGNIEYQTTNLKELSTASIACLGIMMISQNPIAIEGVTNAEMLRVALAEKTKKHVDIFAFQKEAKKICEKLSLPEDFLHRDINCGASGGERKKTEMLHVWMLKPSFLILDEIDSGLDVDALKIVANSIKEYQKETNCSILLVTHNPKLLEILKPNYIHILKNKKISKTGDYSLAKEIEKNGFSVINETNEIG